MKAVKQIRSQTTFILSNQASCLVTLKADYFSTLCWWWILLRPSSNLVQDGKCSWLWGYTFDAGIQAYYVFSVVFTCQSALGFCEQHWNYYCLCFLTEEDTASNASDEVGGPTAPHGIPGSGKGSKLLNFKCSFDF